MNISKPLVLTLVTLALNAFASTQVEIDHLIDYVASTDCQYERNGTRHKGEQAVEHINKKYNYFADEIKTTEDFIQYSATKSELSGRYYKIHCEGEAELNSQNWLLQELQRYRATRGEDKAE